MEHRKSDSLFNSAQVRWHVVNLMLLRPWAVYAAFEALRPVYVRPDPLPYNTPVLLLRRHVDVFLLYNRLSRGGVFCCLYFVLGCSTTETRGFECVRVGLFVVGVLFPLRYF